MVSTRAELTDLIKEAFRGITREGGVSWSETDVLDMYGSDQERAQARLLDKDRSWEDLVPDASFQNRGIGGFSFLDKIGFRYYLPAAMCRSLARVYEDDYSFDTGSLQFHLSHGREEDMYEWHLEKLSLLTENQRSAIAHYLWFVETEEWLNDPWLGKHQYLDNLDPNDRTEALLLCRDTVEFPWREYLLDVD